MPRKPNAALLLSFALLCASVPIGAKDAPVKKEPIVQTKAPARGSQTEKELSEKRSVKTEAAAKQLPADTEVRKTLIKGERPSVRFLLKKQAAQSQGGYGVLSAEALKHPAPKFPQHQNKLENDKIRRPKQFEIEYELAANADVRFTLSSLEGMPVGKLELAAGEVGAREGKNRRIIWDGRDAAGKEAPLGEYLVTQDIEYGKDDSERRVFSLVK